MYAGHAEAVENDLLARENVVFGALLGSPDRTARAMQCLAAMGPGEQADLHARAFSQGQRKRLGLTRLLLASAQSLWVLDEPFSFPDAGAAGALATLLEQHCARGGMIVYTTHQADSGRGAATLDLGCGTERPC